MSKIITAAKILCAILLLSVTTRAQVVINEYSCSNFSSFTDNFGNYEDWIELYNAGSTSVNLTGYHLSDKKTNVTKWTFGNVTIAANGFMRIWASGRNITTGTLHTNFSLTQCKPDMIVFANSGGTILDSLTLQRTQVGHSRGRTTNGAANWSVFLNPTPGTSNNTATAYQNYATTPTMNVAPGFYASAQSITITSPDPNVTIRYTTNGSTPTTGSTVYTGPISVSATKVIRAKAFSSVATVPASFVESNTYFINSPHTVNVASIFGDQILTLMNGTQSTPECGVEYFDSSGTWKTETYGDANKHGNDSWFYNQRGIDFISHDEFGYNYALTHRIFNSRSRKEFQHIIFKAAANDNYPFEGTPNSNFPGEYGGAHIRDAYVETVSQKGGLHLDCRTWAPMVLYVNGQYWGLYDIREKVDDQDYLKYYHNAKGDSIEMLKNWGGVWAAYGGNTAINDWNALKNYITSNNMAVQANYNVVDAQFSTKSFIDYILINSYCVTSDWLNWNSEWWRGLNVGCDKQKWRYCLWDEDATFHHYINYTSIPNQNANADPCDPQYLNPSPPDYGGNIDILNALMANPGFQQEYILRYFDLINTGLSCQRMVDILDSMIQVITPEMPKQIVKWGGTMTQWQQNVTDLRNFILARCDSIQQQFSDCYPVTGPYVIKVNVDPPGAGTVDFNSNHLTNFLWSGVYPGNVTVKLFETPNPNYCFDHWELKNHTPLPSATSDSISINLITTDSIVAHFIYNAIPQVTPANPSVCPGGTITLTASQGQNFTWAPSTGLSCTSCTSTVASPTVNTTYTIIANNGPGCTNQNTVLVTVGTPPAPIITPVSPQICAGQTVTLTATQGQNFTWAPPTALSCTACASTIASPTTNTTYTVTQNSGPGCISSNTVNITIVPPPPPMISPPSAQICPGETVALTGSQGQNFVWSPGTALSCTSCTTTIASPSTNTTYTLSQSNIYGCVSSNTVMVSITPPASANFSSTPQNSTLPEQVQFVSTSSLTTGCYWTFSTGQTSTSCNPVITFTTAGTYTVTLIAQGQDGCNDTITREILVSDTSGLIMPTVFTPNGDGINDYFQPIAKNVSQFSCTIYDRWGKIVFEFASASDKWTGQAKNGTNCPDGTYYYIMSAKDDRGKAYEQRGFITLSR